MRRIFFNITYIRNPGAAFGLFAESGFRIPFLIGVSLVALVAIIVAVHKLPRKDKVPVIALSFIFAGACGNLVDRIRLGEVIDFLDVYWKDYHWPAFNIAGPATQLSIDSGKHQHGNPFIVLQNFPNLGHLPLKLFFPLK